MLNSVNATLSGASQAAFTGSVLRYFGTPEQADIQTNSGSRAVAE
jgi:hypothetical protein